MGDQRESEDKQFGEDILTDEGKPSGVEDTKLQRGSSSSSCVWRPGRFRNGTWIPGHWDCGN